MEPAWLEERRNGVGASEAAAAIGVSPYETPVDLWQRKTMRAPDVEENEAMFWGKTLEPIILAAYEQRTGAIVSRRQEFVRHPKLPFMTCTLDGACWPRIVEVKTASSWARGWGEEDSDEVPEPYLVQVHHQFAVTGAGEADLVVLIGGQRLAVYRITRDDNLVRVIEDRLAEFWQCVQDDTPPTWGRLTPGSLLAINPGCEGEVSLDDASADDIDAIEAAGSIIRKYEATRDEAKLRVLARLRGAEYGVLPDGRRVRRYVQEVAERTTTTRAHTKHFFRVLKGSQ